MEFVWDDGGRSSAGYVGLTGDCVTRAIAIATGTSYRNIYNSLGELSHMTPRNGVATSVSAEFLEALGWTYKTTCVWSFSAELLPKGPIIIDLVDRRAYRSGHYCCVIDHVIYDTWNPSDDDDLVIRGFWTRPAIEGDTTMPIVSRQHPASAEASLTQNEFDKVLHRLRSLDNTANNSASTEGEKRNALRMMQNLLLRHNLSREDITEDDNVDSMRFTRMACPVNGRRAYCWEKDLAAYVVSEIFPMTNWYFGIKGHRTLIWFYGPLEDVKNCITLFRELLLTITASAKLQYGGYSRGSGASYAEGYVRGLPRYTSDSNPNSTLVSETALIHARALAAKKAARNWLKLECGLSLISSGGSGRSQHDPDAADRGKEHGSKHDLRDANGRKQITSS